MKLKQFRHEILNDPDAKIALEKAVEIKKSKYPDITKEKIVDMILGPIAYHESDKTLDPMITQGGSGYARGVYQFEPPSMNHAIVRSKRYFEEGKEPAWIKKIDSNDDYDATKLTLGQQSAMLIYDLLGKTGADIGMVTDGSIGITQFWRQFHWAGKDAQLGNKLETFKKHKAMYQKEYNSSDLNRVRHVKEVPPNFK
jgi:hypothetical protein